MEIKIKDVDEAAFFWCCDTFEFVRLESVSGNNRKPKFLFIFSHTLSKEDFSSLKREYVNNKACVEPNMFIEKQKIVRNILHEGLRN